MSAGIYVAAAYPFEVEIDFTVRTDDGGKVITRSLPRMACGPRPPANLPAAPSVQVTGLTPSGIVEPGQQLRIDYTGSSAAGLWATQVQSAGAFDHSATIGEQLAGSTTRTVPVDIPSSAILDSTATLYVHAIDPFARYTTDQRTSGRILDTVPPRVEVLAWAKAGGLRGPALTGPYFVGDSLLLDIFATDNHRVTKVVWELAPLGLRDSVTSTSSLLSGTHGMRVAADWPTNSEVRVTAFDAGGRSAEVVIPPDPSFRVLPSLLRPAIGVDLTTGSWPMRIDPKRNVIYLAQAEQRRIAVYDLVARAMRTPISLSSAPAGMDLSLGGDSLYAVLPDEDAVAVIDLRPAAPAVTKLAMQLGASLTATRLVTMANGKLFVTTWPIPNTEPGKPLELDPATGQQRFLVGADSISIFHMLNVSAQRNAVILSDANCAQVYDVAGDAFSPCADGVEGMVSLDASGQLALVGHELYTSTMSLIRGIAAADGTIPDLMRPTMLSTDGQYFYAFDGSGVLRSRVSDGVLLDRTPLPKSWLIFFDVQLSPDGRWLAILGTDGNLGLRADKLVVVDLAAEPTVAALRGSVFIR